MKISKNAKIIYGIVAVLFIMGLLFRFSLHLWGVYTVGKIDEITVAKGGTLVSYTFSYNNNKYCSIINEPMRSENVGKHYFVKFLKISPSINLLLPEHPAENCLVYKDQLITELPPCE